MRRFDGAYGKEFVRFVKILHKGQVAYVFHANCLGIIRRPTRNLNEAYKTRNSL